MDTYEAKVYHTVLTCAILLALIIVLFIITLVRHHTNKLRLQKDKLSIEIQTMEMERSRIGRDLHDDISPLLSTVLLHLNSLGSLTEQQAVSREKMKYLLHDVVNKVRETSNDLLPSLIHHKGLVYALNDFVESVRTHHSLLIHTDFPPPESVPPCVSHIHLYRICKEAYHNCIKHAEAENLYFSLKTGAQKMLIVIRDDGKGFDIRHATRPSGGKGLTNILNRVELLDGTLYVDTNPGKGVRYTIDIPIKTS